MIKDVKIAEFNKYTMNKYFYLLFILLSVCCGKKNRITELKMPPVIHLTGEKVETILPRCYETGVLVDSFLVLKEKCTDTMFYLFSTNTDREIFRFGREGRDYVGDPIFVTF